MFATKIAIDLGTSNTIVYIQNRGIIINEPSVVAVSKDKKILAVGIEAKKMLGKTPEEIKIYRPLKDGVISDYRVTLTMIRYFINKAIGRFRLIPPHVMISVPTGITSTERRAVIEATKAAGAGQVYLIKEPLAAAIGTQIPIAEPSGNIVVDIGGGTTEVAVISLGGIVTDGSVRIGGDKLETSIIEYVRRKYNLTIGGVTAEQIKINLGRAIPTTKDFTMNIRGRNLKNGLPEIVTISSKEVTDSFQEELDGIVRCIEQVLEKTPPELTSDILDHGIVMTGGMSLLKDLDRLIAKRTGVPCFTADDALLCVATGIGTVLDNLDKYKKSLALLS